MTSSPIYFSKILYNDQWDMLTVHNGMYIHPEYDDIGTISMDIAQNGQPVRVTGYYPNKDGGIGEIVFTFDLPKPVKTDDRGMTHYEIKHNFLQTGKPGAFRPDERMRFRIAPLAVGENGQNDAAWDAHGMFVNPKAYWVYDKDMKGQPLSDTRSLADKLFGASGAVFPSDIPVLGGLTATLPSIEIFKHTKMFIAMQPDGSVHVSTSTRFWEKAMEKMGIANRKSPGVAEFEEAKKAAQGLNTKAIKQLAKGISAETGKFAKGKWMHTLDVSVNLFFDFHIVPNNKTHSLFAGVSAGIAVTLNYSMVKQFFPGYVPVFVTFGFMGRFGLEATDIGAQFYMSDKIKSPIAFFDAFAFHLIKKVTWSPTFAVRFLVHLELSASAGIGIPGLASISLNFAGWFDLVVPFTDTSASSFEVGCKLFAKLEFMIFFSKNFCLAHAVYTYDPSKNQLPGFAADRELPAGTIETMTLEEALRVQGNVISFSPTDQDEQQWIKSLPTTTTEVRYFKTESSYFAFWVGMSEEHGQAVLYSQYVYNPDSYHDRYKNTWSFDPEPEPKPEKGTVLMGIAATDKAESDGRRALLSYDVCFAGDLCAVAVSYGQSLENSTEMDKYALMYQQQNGGNVYVILYDREMRPTVVSSSTRKIDYFSSKTRYSFHFNYLKSADYVEVTHGNVFYDLHLLARNVDYQPITPKEYIKPQESHFCLTGMRLERESENEYIRDYNSCIVRHYSTRTGYSDYATKWSLQFFVVDNHKVWSGRTSQYSDITSVPLPIYLETGVGRIKELHPVVLFSVQKEEQQRITEETDKDGLTLILAFSPEQVADISFVDRDKGTQEVFVSLGSMITDENGAAFVLEDLQKAPKPKTPEENNHAKTSVSILTIRKGENWQQICNSVVLKKVDLPAADGAHVMTANLNGKKLNYLYWIEAGTKNTAPVGKTPVIEPNYKIRAMVYDIGQCLFTPPFTMLTMKGTANGLRLMDVHGQNDTMRAIYAQPDEEESPTTPGLVNVNNVSVAVQNFQLGYSVAIRDFTTEFPVVKLGQPFKLYFVLENTGVFVVNKVGLHVDGIQKDVVRPMADYTIDLTKPDKSTARLLHADGSETNLQGKDAIFRTGGVNDFDNHPYNILTTFSATGNGGTIIPKTDKQKNILPGFLPGNIHVYATKAVPTPEDWNGDYTLRATVETFDFCVGMNPDDPDMCFTAIRRENANGAADYDVYRASDVVDGVPVPNAVPLNEQFVLFGFAAPEIEEPLDGQDSAAALNALLPDATQRVCDILYNGVTLDADLARYYDEDYVEFTVSNDAGVAAPKVEAEIQVELMNEMGEYVRTGAFPLADQDIKNGMHVTLASSLKHLSGGQRFEKMRLTVLPQDKVNGYSDIYEQGYSTEITAPIQYHFTQQTQADYTMDGKGITLSVQGMGEQAENEYRYYWMRYSPALDRIIQLNADYQNSPKFTVDIVRAQQEPESVYWCVVTDQNGYQISSDPVTPDFRVVPPIPKTGDTASPALWAGLALVSLALTAVLLRHRKAHEE